MASRPHNTKWRICLGSTLLTGDEPPDDTKRFKITSIVHTVGVKPQDMKQTWLVEVELPQLTKEVLDV
jgi:hypothetical protein